MSLNNQAEVDEQLIIIQDIKIFPDISVVRVLISSNEQFLAIIFYRGYNNVEASHYLFKIYDLQTTNQIASGQWISLGIIEKVFQNEFDRYSTYFFEVVQDMLTIVDLQKKILTNRSIEGIQRYLDIDDNGYIYILSDKYVYQYSINNNEIQNCYMFEGILDFKIFSNLQNCALTIQVIDNNSWIILQNMHKKKVSKRIKQTQRGGGKIHNLENHFFVEILNRIDENEDGVREYIEGITLGEMRTGKILRNLVYQFESQDQQLFRDKAQVTLIDKQYKFDLLSGRKKIAPFQFQGCMKFSKNGVVYLKDQILRFVRLN